MIPLNIVMQDMFSLTTKTMVSVFTTSHFKILANNFIPSYIVPVELKNIPDGNYWVKVLDDQCIDDPSPNKPYECYTYTNGVRGTKLDESQHECKVICKPGGVGFKARHRMPLVS